MWALVAIIAVCLLSWAMWITAVVAYFTNSAPGLPLPPCRKWFMVAIGSGTVSFSTKVVSVWLCWFVAACRAGSCSQGFHETYFTGFPPTFVDTSSHPSSIANEFNPFTGQGFPSYIQVNLSSIRQSQIYTVRVSVALKGVKGLIYHRFQLALRSSLTPFLFIKN